MEASSARTLVEVVQSWAAREPDRNVFIILNDTGTETARFTYSDIDARATSIAAELRRLNARGERALLVYPTGPEFVGGVLGCFYAGTIAVPAVLDRSPRALERFRRIVRDAQSTLALTTHETLEQVRKGFGAAPELERLRWVTTDKLERNYLTDPKSLFPKETDLALIQYTSGSTSSPKGIAITHGNLVAMSRMMHGRYAGTSDTRIVSWLPIFHDLCLIGQVFHMAYMGGLCVLMPPMAFLEKPLRWLEAISLFRGTHVQAPTFGYELCTRRISEQDCRRIDLSSVCSATIAAEPVLPSTVRDFARRFAACGFSSSAFAPAYGLAEATLCVSVTRPNQGARLLSIDEEAFGRYEVKRVERAVKNAKVLVSCGPPVPEQQVEIVDPETRCRVPSDRVGEIWVRGPNVGNGYWNNATETERVFCARLADTGEGPFLQTGDLGFLDDGELFIAGRIKDLIIVRGRNHYPQDIELTVETSHSSLRSGCGAAFSLTVDDLEELVILQEIRESEGIDHAAVAAAIQRAISESHGITPYEILLLPPRAILKTSSGKVARRPCREAYVLGQLPVAFRWRASRGVQTSSVDNQTAPPSQDTSSELLLAQIKDSIVRVLKLPMTRTLAPDTDLYDLGMDSASAAELLFTIEKLVERRLSMDFIAKARTPAQMVEYLQSQTRGT